MAQTNNKKVALGLSGGVDSAVCSALLKKAGYTVLGVYLDVGGGTEAEAAARRAAAVTSAEFVYTDVRERLDKEVCAPFAAAYAAGRTPNPCVLCNPGMKFKALAETADREGAAWLSTGHYARVAYFKKAGRHALLRTREGKNDQTYMLSRLGQDVLSRLLLPIGGFSSKDEVRALAHTIDHTFASKPDSMEICFIPDGDYAAYIEARGIYCPPGDMVDEDGRTVGRHGGIHRYTVGQRKGLGVTVGRPMYVTGVDAGGNRVTIGPDDRVYKNEITVSDPVWMYYEKPPGEFNCDVLIRHSKAFWPARVCTEGDRLRVVFDRPARAPAPGQAAVFYRHGVLLGGGFID